jgi:hypothetical protein
MIDIIDAIIALHPNCSFTLVSGDYSNINWIDVPESPATIEQVNDKLAELQAAEPLRLLRIERDRLLQQTDWIITKGLEQDMDLAEWKTYRQALRDLPATAEPQLNEFGNLTNVEWPTPPENS